jgi:hypothetical protein
MDSPNRAAREADWRAFSNRAVMENAKSGLKQQKSEEKHFRRATLWIHGCGVVGFGIDAKKEDGFDRRF